MSRPDLTQTEDFLRDAATRALHTGWEAAGGTAVALWGASGLHANELMSVAGIEKAWTLVGAGVVASFLSAAKSGALAYFKTNRAKAVTIGEDDLRQLSVNMGFEQELDRTVGSV